ncbi:MAG: hypothetical protein ACRDZ7_17195 [Acidimicrobiia bacterium]
MDGMPVSEREHRFTPPEPEVPAGAPDRWAVIGLLMIVALMGAGALGVALSGFTLV